MSGPFGSTAWMANPASGFYDFPITNSVRINVGDSSFLSFTPSSAGNLRAWTWSGWIKRGNAPTAQNATFFSANNADNFRIVGAGAGSADVDTINLVMVDGSNNTTGVLDTLARFRDASSWYHFVIRWDVNNGTALNRFRLYVNGVQITTFSGDNALVDQNTDSIINSAVIHKLGAQQSSTTRDIDGYMAEVNFIDGTSLGPDSFGEFKSDIWIPKDTAGLTFGNQGWRLQFKQVGTGTASSSTIGADTSGNDNHWTSANLAASDVMPDSPTNNFSTLNSVMRANLTISEGNLKVVGVGNNFDNIAGTISFDPTDSRGYYFEYRSSGNDDGTLFGISDPQNVNFNQSDPVGSFTDGADGFGYKGNGGKRNNENNENYGNSYTSGDILSCAIKSGSIFFYKNGTLQNSGTAAYTSIAGTKVAGFAINGTQSGTVNFGQDSSFAGTETAQGNSDSNGIGDFYYAVPSGYVALCTANLPDPVETVDPNKGGSPQDFFSNDLFTGNGTNQDIDIGFVPNLVWTRQRTDDSGGLWMDSVRGDDAYLQTTNANAEGNFGNITFTSTGYNVNGNSNVDNENAHNYVGWSWKAGTSFSNDTSATSVGTIDSAGSVNTDVGFSIIGYTGTATIGTIAHGLSSAPDMLIVKNRSATEPLATYHSSLGAHFGTYLSESATPYDLNIYWNDTEPTSSVFTVNTHTIVNANTNSMIAYCFHEVEGYSKFGKYTGNGNADGTFVYTGFRPAWFMIKRTDSAGSWSIHDTARDTFNVTQKNLYANLDAGEESQATWQYDILSNGIKLIGTSGEINASGGTYIYMAFAEQPFKYANAR